MCVFFIPPSFFKNVNKIIDFKYELKNLLKEVIITYYSYTQIMYDAQNVIFKLALATECIWIQFSGDYIEK